MEKIITIRRIYLVNRYRRFREFRQKEEKPI